MSFPHDVSKRKDGESTGSEGWREISEYVSEKIEISEGLQKFKHFKNNNNNNYCHRSKYSNF